MLSVLLKTSLGLLSVVVFLEHRSVCVFLFVENIALSGTCLAEIIAWSVFYFVESIARSVF